MPPKEDPDQAMLEDFLRTKYDASPKLATNWAQAIVSNPHNPDRKLLDDARAALPPAVFDRQYATAPQAVWTGAPAPAPQPMPWAPPNVTTTNPARPSVDPTQAMLAEHISSRYGASPSLATNWAQAIVSNPHSPDRSLLLEALAAQAQQQIRAVQPTPNTWGGYVPQRPAVADAMMEPGDPIGPDRVTASDRQHADAIRAAYAAMTPQQAKDNAANPEARGALPPEILASVQRGGR